MFAATEKISLESKTFLQVWCRFGEASPAPIRFQGLPAMFGQGGRTPSNVRIEACLYSLDRVFASKRMQKLGLTGNTTGRGGELYLPV